MLRRTLFSLLVLSLVVLIGGRTCSAQSVSISGNAVANNPTTSGTVSISGDAAANSSTASGTVSISGDAAANNPTASGTVSISGDAAANNPTASGTVSISGDAAANNPSTNGTVSISDDAAANNPTASGTVNIFGDAVPNNPVSNGNAVTLGVKFWSSEPGTISGIRFYRAAASPQGYVAILYSADGMPLGSATIAQESQPLPGWQQAFFASPIAISANTTYVAAYYCAVGQGASDPYGLSNGVTNGPLTAPASSAVGGNGVYNYGEVFPSSSYESSNYYVDVTFVPAAGTSPYLVLSFNPPNPSIPANAALGSVVATITASWSDGSPFTGTLSFGPPYSNDQGVFAIAGNDLIVNPSGPGVSSDANTTQNVTIVATQ